MVILKFVVRKQGVAVYSNDVGNSNTSSTDMNYATGTMGCKFGFASIILAGMLLVVLFSACRRRNLKARRSATMID